ncbi:MAG: Rne/Rng family ribonuclease, partial [Bdellovibrionota bacterium]
MLIHARDPGLVRVAILGSDGVLEDLDIESHEHKSLKGSLYKARVVRLEPALGAAFVDFGESKNGFLPLHEVSGRILAEAGSSRARDRVLERGQEVLVQVTREPVGGKGAALTTYIALPGRYLVYLPGGEEGGISRKISSKEERSKLSELVRAIRGQADVGLIVRTAGKDRSKAELQRDFRALGQLWRDILVRYREKKEPGLVWSERGVATRIVRDYYTEEVGEVWVDDSRIYEEVRSFFREALPRKALGRVRFYEGSVPLFHRYRVEDQINQARTRRVSLLSGGSIVIDPTEALVAIDVNSGKLRGEKGIEETAFRTNSEAAREAARQLRLRNLGGIIVIDFIDMRSKKKQQDVERILREALKPDKANVTVGHIGPFGTLEMLRQRLRTSGPWAGFVSCPACEGTGRVPKVRQEAHDALREARSRAAQGAQAEPAV